MNDKIVSDFYNFIDNDKMQIITIYNSPMDYENKWVARLSYVENGCNIPTKYIIVEDSFDELKKHISKTLTFIPRFPNDVISIVGVYI